MPSSNGAFRVLVVDDEAIIANTLALIFSNHGYDARAAYSAEQALQSIEDWPPDMAVLDVQLPGMNGIDLAIRLKAEHPACRLTLFSGFGATSDLIHKAALEGHALEVLAKPVHPEELLRILARRQPLPTPGDVSLPPVKSASKPTGSDTDS